MDYPKIPVKKGLELFPTPTKSGGTKRPCSHEDDGTNAKRNRRNERVPEVMVKTEYHPIASLTPESISPLVRGKLTSISPWCTYTDRKVTCMNFRLEDETGGIPGIMYAPMREDLIRDFRHNAEVIIENAKVQRLRQEFRTTKDQFHIVVNKWTRIRIISAPLWSVETSASAIDNSEASKPVDPGTPELCWTFPSPGVITVQQTSFTRPGLQMTVLTPPSPSFVPINAASRSLGEYPVATSLAGLPTLSATSSIAASPGTARDRFKSVDEVFSNGVPPDCGTLSSINEIQSTVRVGSTIDTIGLVVRVGDQKSQLTRKGYTSTVREITLRDETCSEINLAIWGPDNSIIPSNSVLLVKKATVIVHNETKQLTCIRGSVIVDPDIPEAHRLESLVASVPIVGETVLPRVAELETSFEVSENMVSLVHGNLCSINEVQSKIAVGTTIDVIGLVVQVGDSKTRVTRRGHAASVREVTLRDDDSAEINLAIWESDGDHLYIQVDSVLVANNAKVILYNDKKQLTCLRACVTVDPDIPETHRLKDRARSVPAVAEKAREPVAPITETSSGILPIEVNLVTGSFSSINKIHTEIAVGTKVDLIGFTVQVEEPISRITRKGNAAFVTEVILKDDSDSQIHLAIWEAGQDSSQIQPNSVLLVKNATIIVYNQVKKLTCQRACVSIDPDISQAHRLKEQIENLKETLETETLVPPNTPYSPVQIMMKIDGIPRGSKAERTSDEVSAGTPEAHRIRNLPRSVSSVNETARSPVAAVTARMSSKMSSNKVFDEVPLSQSPINKIHSEIPVGTKVDLIGLTVRLDEPKSRTNRNGNHVILREVTLRDEYCSEIDVAIWEAREDSSPILLNSVLLVKNATVIVYNQVKKLSCHRVSVSIDPDITEAHRLKRLIEDAKEQTLKTPRPVPPEATDNSARTKMRIDETPVESKTDKITDEASVDIHSVTSSLTNLASSVSGVTENSHHHPAPTADERSSGISPFKVPHVVINLCPIDRIHLEIPLGAKVDLIGLAVRVEEPKLRMTRQGYDACLREVILRDDSCSEIDVAIWETREDSSPIMVNSVLLVRNATVIIYNRVKKLTCQRISVSIEPDMSQDCTVKHRIEDAREQTPKTESRVLANGSDGAMRIKAKIHKTLEGSETTGVYRRLDEATNEISADRPAEADRLRNVARTVEAVTENAQPSGAVADGTDLPISSNKGPRVILNLCPIDKIHSEIAKGTKIHLIGSVVRMEVPKRRMTKKGEPAVLSEVTLRDDSGYRINVAIWEAGRSEYPPILLDSVLLIENATVLLYNNVKKLSCHRVSVSIDPDILQNDISKKKISHADLLETQKIDPAVLPEINPEINPEIIDLSKPLDRTIGETPKASKTDVLGVVPRLRPVRHSVGDDETIPEASGLENLPRNYPVVTAKSQSSVAVVADTRNDISSNKVSLVNDHLCPIKMIHAEIAVGTKIDSIGLVVRVRQPKLRTPGKECDAFVREVTLRDDACSEIDVTIWEEAREVSFSIPLNSVLLVKNAAVIFYNEEKKLTCQGDCVSIDPDIPRALELKKKIKVATCETQTDSSTLETRPIQSSSGEAKNRYTPIDKIHDDLSAGMTVNILGIVTHRDPVEHSVKADRDNYKAKMVIVDQTRRKITMTVWGPRALTLSDKRYWIVEGSDIKVHEYNGEKQLTCTERLSTLNPEPNTKQAKELWQWFGDVWLKAEECYAAAAADYKSNSKKKVENVRIRRQVLPVPASPDHVNYTPIGVVHREVTRDSTINILGIADWVKSLKTIKKVNGTVYMREINVLDDSRKSIWVTIWGDKAVIDPMCHNVVAIINATVRVNNNVKDIVCSDEESLFIVDPCTERTRELLDWYKINALDNIFVETAMPITPNNLVFSTFQCGEKTSVIGVIVKIHESRYLEGRTGARLDVCRIIELIDDSEETIKLLMWGEAARDSNLLEETILLVTDTRVFVKVQYKACVSSAWSHFVVDPIAPNIRDKVKRLELWWCGYKMRQAECRVNGPVAPPDAHGNRLGKSLGVEPMNNSTVRENVADPTNNFDIDEIVSRGTINSSVPEEDRPREYPADERQRWDF